MAMYRILHDKHRVRIELHKEGYSWGRGCVPNVYSATTKLQFFFGSFILELQVIIWYVSVDYI